MFVHDGRLATLQKKNIEKPDLPAVVSYALWSWLLYILDNAGSIEYNECNLQL